MLEHADIVIGQRKERNDPLHRKILSQGANFFTRALFDCKAKDLNIPFKLFRREKLNEVLRFIPRDALIPSILIMTVACRMNLRIRQVPVKHLPRSTGRCSLPGKRLLIFSIKALYELLCFRNRLSHHPVNAPADRRNRDEGQVTIPCSDNRERKKEPDAEK
jgi:hypothetical protein